MLRLKPLLAVLLFVCAAYGSLVDDIVNAIENAVDCGACHALLVPLQGLAVLGDSTSPTQLLQSANPSRCTSMPTRYNSLSLDNGTASQAHDPDVYEGIIKQQGPILAHDPRSISALGQTATKLCDAVFGLCQPPDIKKYTVPFPKPAPTNPKVFASKGRAPFQVAHFSDAHIDRDVSPPGVPAGPMPGEHNRDTTTALAQSMLHAISANNAFPFDVVEASVWLVNQTIVKFSFAFFSRVMVNQHGLLCIGSVTKDMQTFNNEMATILGAPVYPAVGWSQVSFLPHWFLYQQLEIVLESMMKGVLNETRSTTELEARKTWLAFRGARARLRDDVSGGASSSSYPEVVTTPNSVWVGVKDLLMIDGGIFTTLKRDFTSLREAVERLGTELKATKITVPVEREAGA
ncbi:hypothetical protein FPV67DRAFT_1450641 [Lyophyllum atratum]|nr:hypothetical protein FPV67DRAFT_1450641 [Lyophyllum atratum]